MSNRRSPHTWMPFWCALALVGAFAISPTATAQNQVVNGGFDTNLAGWTVGDGNTETSWSTVDAASNPSSGSLRLANPAVGALPRNISQCIEVGPEATVHLSGHYLLEGVGGSGAAILFALQYPTADCSGSGTVLPGANLPGSAEGSWSPLVGSATLGEGFRAIDLRLAVIGNGRTAHFDNVAVEVSDGGPIGECVPDATTLCLAADRYQVRARWRTTTANGDAQAVEIEDSTGRGTGYFWFFNPANVEVVVKVIEACSAPYHRVWVFAGGLTNQEVELRVIDTTTGAVWTHLNPLGQVWETVTDTQALDVCD